MERRAQSMVFWPGITNDTQRIRATSLHCITNAPSQAQTPSIPAIPPSTPFDMIVADFFDFRGNHYFDLLEIIYPAGRRYIPHRQAVQVLVPGA